MDSITSLLLNSHNGTNEEKQVRIKMFEIIDHASNAKIDDIIDSNKHKLRKIFAKLLCLTIDLSSITSNNINHKSNQTGSTNNNNNDNNNSNTYTNNNTY